MFFLFQRTNTTASPRLQTRPMVPKVYNHILTGNSPTPLQNNRVTKQPCHKTTSPPQRHSHKHCQLNPHPHNPPRYKYWQVTVHTVTTLVQSQNDLSTAKTRPQTLPSLPPRLPANHTPGHKRTAALQFTRLQNKPPWPVTNQFRYKTTLL